MKYQYRITRVLEQEISRAEYEVIQTLCKAGQKVTAIKFARDQYKLPLLEAKELCDSIASSNTL